MWHQTFFADSSLFAKLIPQAWDERPSGCSEQHPQGQGTRRHNQEFQRQPLAGVQNGKKGIAGAIEQYFQHFQREQLPTYSRDLISALN
jgi:hypothetical protein